MCKKLSLLALVSLLLLVDLPLASAHNVDLNPNNPNIWGAPDPTTMVIDSPFEPATLDPAYAYDEVSQEVIMNVYEPLLFFDRDYTLGPYDAGKVDQFVPKLATSWTEQTISETSPEGLLWVKRWTFTIRTNVKFQDWNPATPTLHILTPEDVEYSFERLLVQDRSGGPAWTLYEPLLGAYRAAEPNVIPNWGLRIDHAVESDGTTVWFNLVSNFPSVMFKQIMSQTWSGVVERTWAEGRGDLNIASVEGGWSNWAYIYNTWHDPPISFIDDVMMGTGPYKLAVWNKGSSLALVRFVDYWDGWPAWKSEARTERIGGYINTVIWNWNWADWADRRPRFLMGTTDTTYVDRPFRDQVLGQPGIRSLYRSDSLSLSLGGFFFNFYIDTSGNNPFVHKWYALGTFGENGIPRNIFSDVNVRKGFAYAFNYPAYLTSMYFGEGEIPSDPVIKGLPYDSPAQAGYTYDTVQARYYLRLAWGGVDNAPYGPPWNNLTDTPGALWNNGMKFTITYPAGNVALEHAAIMLRDNINSLHTEGKFHVDTMALQWHYFASGVYLAKMPLFVLGYQGDFPDPHDFVHDFMYSQGTLASFQSYDNPDADDMIKDGILTPDGPQRQQIYYDLQAIYHDDVPSVPFAQPFGREFERTWMRGWYNNPIMPGRYIYHRWKALTHFGDANNDGLVDVADYGVISAHWSGPPSGAMGYAPQADLSGGIGGTTGSLSGPVPGIPDGTINIIDISIVSAYYDGPPAGSSHP